MNLFTGEGDNRELNIFNIKRRIGDDDRIISVSIRTNRYDEGIGPIVVRVDYDRPIDNRRIIMDAIIVAYGKWYAMKKREGEKTVKVWIPGREGRWIGNGKIPSVKLA